MLPRYTSKCRKLFTFKAVSIMHVTLQRQSWCQWINNESGSATGLGLAGEAEGDFPALGALCQWRPSLVRDLLTFYEVQSWPKIMEALARLALTKAAAHGPAASHHSQAQKSQLLRPTWPLTNSGRAHVFSKFCTLSMAASVVIRIYNFFWPRSSDQNHNIVIRSEQVLSVHEESGRRKVTIISKFILVFQEHFDKNPSKMCSLARAVHMEWCWAKKPFWINLKEKASGCPNFGLPVSEGHLQEKWTETI